MKTNTRHILLGILLLLIGSLVYIIDRPGDRTYFIFALPFKLSLYNTYPPLFGRLGDSLPHFLHVMAFILMTAGIMDCGKKGYALICLFWLTLCAGFELGQKYSTQAAALVPDWFEGVFLLENTKNYFLRGTYCRADLAAIVAGSALAFLWLTFSQKPEPEP